MKIKEILQIPLTIISDVDDDTKEVFYGTIGEFIAEQLDGYDISFFPNKETEEEVDGLIVRYGSVWK